MHLRIGGAIAGTDRRSTMVKLRPSRSTPPEGRPPGGTPAGGRGFEDTEREVIEVDVERIEPVAHPTRSLRGRVWAAVAPVLLAMFIDVGDLAMIVPFGRVVGLPVGMLAGYLYAGFLNVPPTWRMVITVVTGLYFMAPFTSFVPMATVTAAVVQVVAPERLRHEPF